LATLFQYHNFREFDVRMASWSLMAQSTAVPAFLLVKVLAPAFYARQDTRTPVKAAVVSVLVNAACTLLFFLALLSWTDAGRAALAEAGGNYRNALAQVPGAHALLALAIAVAGWVNASQLAWYLRRAKVYRRQPGWGKWLRQVALASLLMVAVIAPLLWLWQDWNAWAWWQRVWRLTILVGTGGAAYAATLWLQGIRLRELRGH
jgi:putative peptidoglycan lipid II flippase